MTDTGTEMKVVVGFDGSLASRAALEWAAQQAALTHRPLEVVTTWDYPVYYGWEAAPPIDYDLAEAPRSALAAAIDELRVQHPDLDVTPLVVEGPPTLVLAKHSEHATLLVVGCRGLGAFRGMLLGSVSAYLAVHARCPVVIVHDHDEAVHTPTA